MITFIVSLIVLLLGFTVYSRVAERVFGPDDRLTPGVRKADGIDFIVLPPCVQARCPGSRCQAGPADP